MVKAEGRRGLVGSSAASAVPTTWPLIGRVDELDQAIESLAATRGAVLSGAAGVGKSRLADEVLAAAGTKGWATFSVAAGPETVAAPFSPFASLLGDDQSADPVARFLRAARALAAKGDRVLLAIDDAHQLDEISVAFVRHLATATEVRLLLTVRSGVSVPATIVTLWQAQLLRRIEVLPLAEEEITQLLRMVLPGSVRRPALRWVWQTCRGNPLFAHELVLDAVERGALVQDKGAWRRVGSVEGAGSRLQEVVSARVGSLDPDERRAVELLALGEPLGLAMLERLTSPEVVAKLDERGLLAGRTERRRSTVRLAHPLHGEVVRATMGITVARDRRRQLIDGVTGAGTRREGDDIRVAIWRCEAGDLDDWPSLLRAAERLAGSVDRALVSALHGIDGSGFVPRQGHLEQAVTLVRGALDGGGGVEAAALLIRLLSLLGRDDEADAVHAEALATSANEADELALLRARVGAALYDEGDSRSSRVLLEDFVERVAAPEVRAAAVASLALLTALTGAPADALALARPLLEAREGEPGDRLAGMAAVAVSLGEAGLLTEALSVLEASVEAIAPDEAPGLAIWLSLVQGLLLCAAGRLSEADELSRTCFDAAARTGDVSAMGLFTALGAHVALERGHADQAVTLAGQAVDRMVDLDPYGARRIALALQVHASALTGAVGEASAALATIDESGPGGTSATQEQRARAWFDVAGGNVTSALARLQVLAEAQARSGHVMREAAALYDLARLNHAGVVERRLIELAATCDSEVLGLMAAHVQASVARDADRVSRVGQRWSDLTFDLFAAEAHAEAARLYEAGDRGADASTARVDASAARARCGTVFTPALVVAGPVATLTKREREIAELAARGLSDRQIADELVISARTVQSHLYFAYAKLGVEGRAGLASVLGLR